MGGRCGGDSGHSVTTRGDERERDSWSWVIGTKGASTNGHLA
jgi:hypothetical protein